MRILSASLLAASLFLGACSADAASEDGATPSPDAPTTASPTATASPEATSSAQPSPTPSSEPTAASPSAPAMSDAELAGLGVNELGRVLVMEWHALGDTDGRWENSLDTFRAQLRELYDTGFRPISVDEFIEGTFPIPAGTSPVLLTFDDSYKSHMYFGEDGEPAEDSVVGILQAMEAEDPTWRARASFSFYWPVPFRETDPELIERKMNYLVDHGFDLSNHTYNHDNLREMTDAEVVENLARAELELEQMLDEDYRIRSMTLTQGIWPQNPDLAMAGEWNGFVYDHDIAFEVGFMPTRSPHHAEYDPRSIQRVQAYIPEFRKWMDWFEEDPQRRFVSDGDPAVVTYPASFAEVAAPDDGVATRVYEDPADASG